MLIKIITTLVLDRNIEATAVTVSRIIKTVFSLKREIKRIFLLKKARQPVSDSAVPTTAMPKQNNNAVLEKPAVISAGLLIPNKTIASEAQIAVIDGRIISVAKQTIVTAKITSAT